MEATLNQVEQIQASDYQKDFLLNEYGPVNQHIISVVMDKDVHCCRYTTHTHANTIVASNHGSRALTRLFPLTLFTAGTGIVDIARIDAVTVPNGCKPFTARVAFPLSG